MNISDAPDTRWWLFNKRRDYNSDGLNCEKCKFYCYCISDMNKHNKTKKHMNNINNIIDTDKKIQCNECIYGTNDKSNYNRHMEQHKINNEKYDYYIFNKLKNENYYK